MIKKLVIDKLFGRFCYTININENDVTIITGPNGFGKSTILKIINELSNANINYFFKLDFFSITAFFDKEQYVKIVREDDAISFNDISITYAELENIKRFSIPWLRRIGPETWLDRRTGKRYYGEDIILSSDISEEFTDFLDGDSNIIKSIKSIANQLKEWSGNVRLISEQRLIRQEHNRRTDEDQIIEVISELPDKLLKQINTVSSEYSRVANRLDSSYPKRLFATKEGIGSKEEYESKLKAANSKFNKLNEYKLVDMTLIEKSRYNNKFAEALKIYFDDFSEKYKVFEPLIRKLDLFTQIINERLMFKKVQISGQTGFEVIDSDFPERKLSLNQLSSGEKQEIVLFYDLIFNTNSDFLLLIDEPEISLHIAWQKKFLDDMLKVADTTNLQIIVATHSPQIVSNHWDIQIDLGAEYGKEFDKR